MRRLIPFILLAAGLNAQQVGTSVISGGGPGVGGAAALPTVNVLPKITSPGVLGESGISDDGTTVATARKFTAAPGGAISAWASYTFTKIANTVNGCTNAKGCWQLNGAAGAGTTPAAAVTQPLTVLALPANGAVEDVRIKTAVACVNGGGTATITSVGLTGTANYYATGLTYNLETAVGDTNLLWPAMAARGSNTVAGTNVTITLTADAGNIQDWADGCSVTTHLKWAVLP